jgi:hypothetical protein
LVIELLKTWLDEMNIDAPMHDGSYVFATGAIAVILTPDDGDENGGLPVVSIECPVLIKPRLGVNLYRDLLNRNANVPLGAFNIEDDSVFFTYTFPALDGAGAHFAEALKTVARIANDASAELQTLHGGKRVGDR